MKNTYLLLLVLSIISCTRTPDQGEGLQVVYHGALKNFMMKGDISAKADLAELKDIDHLYALGALEKLKGEILDPG
jgi:hypothetical protein